MKIPNGTIILFENCQRGVVFNSKREGTFKVRFQGFCRAEKWDLDRKPEDYSVTRLIAEMFEDHRLWQCQAVDILDTKEER